MSTPKGYVKFDNFRDQIATRYDRADPNGGMTLNYEDLYINPEERAKGKATEFTKMSERMPN